MARAPRFLMAKTSLDGHWRGVLVVSRALRDAGFEVVQLGQATADEIATAAAQEDVDVVGLNIGGRVEVALRVIEALRDQAGHVPVIAGGTVPPWAVRELESRGVKVFPPGSSLGSIVATARELAAVKA